MYTVVIFLPSLPISTVLNQCLLVLIKMAIVFVVNVAKAISIICNLRFDMANFPCVRQEHLFNTLGLILLLFFSTSLTAQTKNRINWTTEVWSKVSEENKSGAYFDLLAAVYDSSEFELKHTFLPYKRGIQYLREGRADIISICHPMDDFYRAKHPWAQESFGVLFNEGSSIHWLGVNSIRHKVVALNKNLADLPEVIGLDAQMIFASSEARALKLLVKNRADFYLGVYINIKNEVANNPNISMSQFTFKPLSVLLCHPGFTPSEKGQQLRRVWDLGIERLNAAGQLKSIFQKWGLEYPNYQWDYSLIKHP